MLAAPILETLGYLILLKEENELKHDKDMTDKWIHFLSVYHAHPRTDADARKKFMKTIEPQMRYDPVKNPIPVHDWDMEELKRLKELQERG